jgi:hypothetical protein
VHLLTAGSLVLLATLQANAACELPPLRTNERPVVDDGPTKVYASVIVADFMDVDDVNQQLDIDMRVRFHWTDPRLEGLEGCRFNVTEVWFPQAIILNSTNLRVQRTNARNQVVIGKDGEVHYAQRATGLISSYHNLRAFPFDSHDFLIEFASIEVPADELVFIPVLEDTWINDRLNIEGWFVNSLTISSKPEELRDTGFEVSVLKLIISADRNPEYYVYRVLSLLAFVVAMSWTIFWIPPSRFEFQIGLGATSMLTAIAFNLSLATQLPTLGYMTTLDRMLIWSIILVFLSIVQALVSGRMVMKDQEELALKLDRVSRYLFPAALFLGWLSFYLAV